MKEVQQYLINLLNDGDSVVVAVSGGPDSMVLLYQILEIKNLKNIKIICAHVNHKLRKESDQEYIDVEKYCQNNNITFEGMIINKYENGNFKEDEARTKRYKFFEELVYKYKAKYLFTAHHGDDLIETVLMKIVRGSNIKGYAGFARETQRNNYQIIRPLITVTKEEILDFCGTEKIEYATDLSNEKDDYTRNRYRKYILPNLKKEDLLVHEKFYRFSKILLENDRYINSVAQLESKKIINNGVLDIKNFTKLDKIIKIRIIYNLLETIYKGKISIISDKHIENILKLIESDKANSYINLPDNRRAIKTYNKFEVEKASTYEPYEYTLENKVVLPNGKEIEKLDSSNQTDNFICYLDSNEIELPLILRSRKQGDKIEVLGLNGTKSVKDIFINSKIPENERNTWPILVDNKGKVLWIPGVKKSKFDKTKSKKYDIIFWYH